MVVSWLKPQGLCLISWKWKTIIVFHIHDAGSRDIFWAEFCWKIAQTITIYQKCCRLCQMANWLQKMLNLKKPKTKKTKQEHYNNLQQLAQKTLLNTTLLYKRTLMSLSAQRDVFNIFMTWTCFLWLLTLTLCMDVPEVITPVEKPRLGETVKSKRQESDLSQRVHIMGFCAFLFHEGTKPFPTTT